MFLLQADDNYIWLAPYAYGIVVITFILFLFRVFENWYANKYDKPFMRQLFSFRKLPLEQKQILENEFSFYNKLSNKHKKQFEHRIVKFIADKNFIGRDDLVITERMKLLIAAVGCMLSFGRKNYKYKLIHYILVYPDSFYSTANEEYHAGEFNPRERALVLSWKVFEKGFKIIDDNLNLGIHEFMHAMQLEAKQNGDVDATRFTRQFQNILKRLTNQGVKDRLDETRFFRAYAFTNQYEFMAVLTEYFFESPQEFKNVFPELYSYTKKLLNFNFAGY